MNANRDDQNPYSSTDFDEPTVPGPKTTTTSRGRFWAMLAIGIAGVRAVALVPETWSFANPTGYQVALAQMIGCVISAVLACVAWLFLGPNSNHTSWGRLALGLSGFIFVLSLLII